MKTRLKIGTKFKKINIVLSIIMAISFAGIVVFRSSASLQSHLFDFMESFFHRSLDRAEWQERFNGSWVFFPLVAELKLLVLMWIGLGIVKLQKSDAGIISENDKINRFFGSRKLAVAMTAIIVILFAVAIYFTPVCVSNGSGKSANIVLVLLGAVFYVGAIVLFSKVPGHFTNKVNFDMSPVNRKILWMIFLLIIVIDLIWFAVFYPGVAMTDTRVIVFQGLSISSQHPWIYCLMVDFLVRIMSAIGYGYEGVFVFMSITQILLSAFVFTHCIYVLMREHVNKYICGTIAAVYIIYPVFGFFTIYLVKDIIFSLVIIEWMIFLYDYWKNGSDILKERKDYVRVIALCIGLMLRNNGLYMILFALLCMLLMDICQYKNVLFIAYVLVCTMALTSTVETAGGITHNFRETVGIPIQQICAVIVNDGNVGEEEKEFVSGLLPIEEIKKNYNPYFVDSIKFNERFDWKFLNANKREFLSVWSDMLTKNLRIYIEAYGKATCGFWAVKRGYIELPDSLNYAFDKEFTDSNGISVKAILPERLQNMADGIMYPLADMTLGEGQLLWIILLLGMVLILTKGNGAFIIVSPLLGGYITLFLATPGAYSWRYIYFAALAVPFLVGLLFADRNKPKTSF